MSDQVPAILFFAPEIEMAVISLLWHEPERCAQFLREFDPAVAIIQPYLRTLLQAISLSWSEANAADWASVVQVLRELGQLEACGGLQALNEVYVLQDYGQRLAQPHLENIWRAYLAILRNCIENRVSDPPRPPDFFTRGELRLYATGKQAPKPYAIGKGKIAGKLYQASAWLEADQFGRQFLKIKCQIENR
jgi:hypothetical protein